MLSFRVVSTDDALFDVGPDRLQALNHFVDLVPAGIEEVVGESGGALGPNTR